MKQLFVVIAVGLLTAANLGFDHTRQTPGPGCLSLNSGTADVVMGDLELYASDTAFRASHGVLEFPADSAQFYDVPSACDSAEVTYRAWRVTQGDPNVIIPVALMRLGGTKMFLGTALIGRYGYGREYVVYDSIFTVKHVFSYH